MSVLTFPSDPILDAMNNHDYLWGDILLGRSPLTKPWIQPLLLTRKDIWTHYPVTVVPLGSDENGAECHAIEWHRTHLTRWMDLWSVPRSIVYERLMLSLKESKKWFVDPARNRSMICVIRMRFATPKPQSTLTKTYPSLTCLNDIKQYYPVVWHLQETKSDYPVYSVELYGNILKKMSQMGKDMSQRVKNELYAALKASSSWIVLHSEHPREVCRLMMIPSVVRKS